jgi:hypothetical protein
MRVLVTGGRKYANQGRVYSALDAVHAKHGITLLIEGGATGADRLARGWAITRGIPFEIEEVTKEDWVRYGKRAGIMRNAVMLIKYSPEAVVAFKGGTGTADMVAKAEAAGVPVWRVPEPRRAIFVFGSNMAGRHGRGAALAAGVKYGAIYGQAEGLQGDSYAIPTKDALLRPLPLATIARKVETFKSFAAAHPELRFMLTPIGCGLAGYQHHEIAPMFAGSPPNVDLPAEFLAVPPFCN